MGTRCSNCGGPDAAHRSLDLDLPPLPPLLLCDGCAFALVHDPTLFEQLRITEDRTE